MATLTPRTLQGHSTVRTQLRKLLAEGKLPHAILFNGPPGVGKRLLAQQVACCLLDGVPPTLETIQTLSPQARSDMIEISGLEKDDTDADATRQLLSTVYTTSTTGRGKVVIIDAADKISTVSANILLKTLEEPRPGQTFFLITSNSAKVLPTILSRCQRFHFAELDNTAIEKIAQDLGIDRGQTPTFLAQGSAEQLGSLTVLHERWQQFAKMFDAAAKGNPSDALLTITEIAKEKEQIQVFLQMLRLYASTRLQSTLDHRWAVVCSNALTTERLIFERNAHATSFLSVLVMGLAKDNGGQLFEEIFDVNAL